MRVEVVYALADEQHLVALDLPPGTRAADAVRASGLAARFADVDPDRSPLAVFGRACEPGRVLRPGERVEVLRPLQVDPKEARRHRARRTRR